MEVDTIPKILLDNKTNWPKGIAIRQKDRGLWKEFSWSDVYTRVKYLALGFKDLGLEKGDKVLIIGDNEPQWIWGSLAVISAGGISTGIFVDAVHNEIEYIVNHSDGKFAIAEDQEQVDKFLDLGDKISNIEKIVYWDGKGLANYSDPRLLSFGELAAKGRNYEKKYAGVFEDLVAVTHKRDICNLYYTSGTSGLPKGALLTHDALIFSSKAFLQKAKLTDKNNLISVLPAAWVGDTIFSTVPHLISRSKLNFPEEPETVQEDLREIGPHVVINGPKQWEGMAALTEFKITDGGRIQRFLYRLIFPIGLKRAKMKVKKQNSNIFWKITFFFADMMVFKPLLDKLGLRNVQVAITGSAAMSNETFQFWRALGLELRQMYASTEVGFISGHDKDDIRDDTIGTVAPGVNVEINSDGETCVKSPGLFSGYYKDTQKTEEVLIDGWFRTGDACTLDENSHLVFIDRLADLKKLGSGYNYSPQYIEGLLRTSPYIKECVVVGGEERTYIIVLIDIRFDNVGSWAESQHISYTTLMGLSQEAQVAKLIRKDVLRVNNKLDDALKIRKFIIFPKELDADEAEITRTRKLRRGLMEERYKDLINSIYSELDEFIIESEVSYQDGRTRRTKMPIRIREV